MEYDRYRTQVGELYANFKNAILANYLGRLTAGADMSAVNQFRQSGMTSVARFAERAAELTSAYVTQSTNGVPTDSRVQPYISSLHLLASRNLNDLVNRLMTGGGRTADLFSQPAGAMGLLLQKKLATPELTSIDRAGRRWSSEKLVMLMARDFAYQTALDASIAGITGDLAEVVYADPTHAHHGMIVSISGDTPDYPSVASVRATIFHPNATAQLRQHVQS